MGKVSLTVNGRHVQVPEGSTILEAARKLGVDIPTFCYDPHLSIDGSCRICMVEEQSSGQLMASCAMPAAQDMDILTESERVIRARRGILELMLASHEQECLTCERTGNCRLQDYAYRYAVEKSPFTGEKREVIVDDANPFYIRDYNKCIYCGKCVRVCHEVQGVGAIDFSQRGFSTRISTPYEENIENSACVFCGLCMEICPVGALIPKHERFAGRPWEVKKVTTICPYCGVGCNLTFKVKDTKIAGVEIPHVLPNRGQVCVKGKFGWDYVEHEDRLQKPLIRKQGILVEASWEEALDYTARRLKEVKDQYGSGALGGLCSAKCTNEENYLFQKFMRTALLTHSVDHCARL